MKNHIKTYSYCYLHVYIFLCIHVLVCKPIQCKHIANPIKTILSYLFLSGHWEGDLISGSNNSHIATLVERHTRYVMLVRVKGKDTETVISALIKHAHQLPTELYKSLTWDRGKEMADHQRFTLATDI